ncbi:MAG: Uncharacterized protein G01um101413_770 [Parcubacteria group bacterium Gr01-1014_13]|nr:MAG: Uncharacterized protein G01um101413_770 [Parcubacteria group bacterium Gr01-1014_13]
MSKGANTTKKIHLRRCAVCQKVGHNKSTCPEAVAQNIDKPVNQPLKFFVHHVNYNNHQSPHLVNLKEHKKNLYEDVQSVGPKKNTEFYFDHDTPVKQIPKITTPSFSPNIKANKRATNTTQKKSTSNLGQNIKTAFDKASSAVAPKHLAGVAMVILFLLFVPSRARTYYFDLKSTANKISDNSTAGFSALQDSTSALMSGNLEGAQESLTGALQNFDKAVKVLNSEHQILQKIVSVVPIMNGEMQSRQRLITAGQEISLGNTYLLKGLSEIRAVSSTITKNLALLGEHLRFSLPHYQTALIDLNKVDSDVLPFEYQNTFKEFRILFNAYVGDLEKIAKLNSAVQEIFGGQGLRRYLLVFQNPDELRATGGFMGSFALLDIKDGDIVKIDIPAGGTYDLQGQLSQYVAPPTPLLLSNKRWEFQDANWFPDFPASAKKILWFYRHGRNMTADGVISINATVLNRLLSIVGPVVEENHNVVIDKETALTTIQHIVEYGPEKKENKPKQILSDLAPIFISNFKKMKAEAVLPMLANLQEALQEKEIQSYFTDTETENTIKEFGWSGEILKTNPDQDYLFVVNTNIQGQKSDARIKQTISHQAIVQPDGTILDSVVISREHTGQAEEKLYGQTNIDYLRIYVPAGSELVRASGFIWPDEQIFRAPESWYEKDATLSDLEKEISIDSKSGTRITSEFGKTAFANWLITEPGQTNQIQFIYKLPFKAWEQPEDRSLNNWAKIFQSEDPSSKYQLIVQKQSGITSNFDSQIIYPEGWSPIWQNGDGVNLASNGAAINSTELNNDKIWSLVMKKNE